jgi:hypothetical protein
VPNVCIVRVVVGERQASSVTNIHVVRIAVTSTVVTELALFDDNFAGGVDTAENAVFIVVNKGRAQGEVRTLHPQCRAVLVWYLGTVHFHVIDNYVATAYNPCRLAKRIGAVGTLH